MKVDIDLVDTVGLLMHVIVYGDVSSVLWFVRDLLIFATFNVDFRQLHLIKAIIMSHFDRTKFHYEYQYGS